jgi:hypothetical protein
MTLAMLADITQHFSAETSEPGFSNRFYVVIL